ncbi:hypothetical protein [Gordonia insulae]|nr:hypothetical protein [Gordonia insulae]
MDSLEAHMISMMESPTWVLSHVIAMTGTVLIAASLALLARSIRPHALAPFVTVAAVGASLAAIEYIPHILAVTELEQLRVGGPAPITRTHELIAAFSGPLFGFGTAVLAIAVAVTATRHRVLWWTATIPAVVGGTAAGLAVPLVLVTRDVQMTVLFPGVAGVAVWYMAFGVAVALRTQAEPTSAPARTELAQV